MTTLTVGSGKQFTTITSAIQAAKNGDVINVSAGIYTNDFPPNINVELTLSGIGGMAHMTATKNPPNGKGFLCAGNDATFSKTITINHFEFSNAVVPDSNNGAGIRYQGGHLVLNSCYFHNNQNGILGGPGQSAGWIEINDCEFFDNGFGDGFTHNIYVVANKLNIKNSYFHSCNGGHELKSRCANTVIINSRIQNEFGNASYCLDFPNGGDVTVQNSVIQKSVNSPNRTCMIAFGEEGSIQARSSLVIKDNTLINDCPNLTQCIWNASTVPAIITGNLSWNIKKVLLGPGNGSDTKSLAAEPGIKINHPMVPPPTPPIPTPIPPVPTPPVIITADNVKSKILDMQNLLNSMKIRLEKISTDLSSL